MSTPINNTIQTLCAKIYEGLENIAGENNPTFLSKKTGVIDLLVSDQNRIGNSTLELRGPDPGQLRRGVVRYLPRADRSLTITDYADMACDGAAMDDAVANVDYGFFAGEKLKIERDTLVNNCQDPAWMGGYFMNRLISKMAAVRESVSSQILAHMATNCVGVNVNNIVSNAASASAKSVELLDSAGNALPNGLSTLRQDFAKNQMNGKMFVLSDIDNFDRFNTAMQFGCCNDGGWDLNAVAQSDPYYYFQDQNVTDQLGTNNFLTIAPGTVQLFFGSKNAGSLAQSWTGDHAHISIADPILGDRLMYDLDIVYQPCDDHGTYFFQIGTQFGLWCWPTDVFPSGDDLRGVTGAFLYTASQQS